MNGVKDTDGECLGHATRDLFCRPPIDFGGFGSRLRFAGHPFAAHNESDHTQTHVLVHAGEPDGSYCHTRFLADFSDNSSFYGLAEFKDATRKLPRTVVMPFDDQHSVLPVCDDGGHTNGVSTYGVHQLPFVLNVTIATVASSCRLKRGLSRPS